MARRISMATRSELVEAIVERYRSGSRSDKRHLSQPKMLKRVTGIHPAAARRQALPWLLRCRCRRNSPRERWMSVPSLPASVDRLLRSTPNLCEVVRLTGFHCPFIYPDTNARLASRRGRQSGCFHARRLPPGSLTCPLVMPWPNERNLLQNGRICAPHTSPAYSDAGCCP
ncbi:hypothetical protein EN962_05020 [Mesorhizobium sp. M7A.F.Ca.CA.001.09.2.1]|nr:hypothetical protein EN981_06125 [Mesorhizobium sp. M7A.F.Ca.CA.001.13.2.1]RUY71333.1 hypothetical protein EN980_06195 [Mesorhizobium sp. M7A.F.Ca.CA.001.13.1.1]RUY74438.1 hypothetical protein EN965_01180 [Mesorhizobium sp. M7A.F.Ca.CA.001.05.1.1]RUY80586.1 hypothetical protein EN962_05020 [Mesorhizobium sp. M7A.F.Ca.CA.001.09.2.1]RUZ06731.1 hypothetical protein EN955_14480 [Mesorhizobium sp. M7A.F.Ca.CA.001.04.2.1]RUZ16818.1 hypothetical protein EN961_25315 [Mesorhizobium sp. M7A.F.Ca.CA.0